MRRLSFKLLALALLVLVLQLVLVPRLRKMKDVRYFENAIALQPDVLFFGDSTNAWVDAEDVDRRAISTILNDLLPESTVAHLTRAAYHVEIYEAFVDLIIARGLYPRAIVIPVNLRSFSPEWDQRPAYQFEVAKRQIRNADSPLDLALDPLLRTMHLDEDESISQHQYKETPVYCGEEIVGAVRDFDNPLYQEVTEERTRNKMIFHYMYPLREDHRKLGALERIADKARRAGLEVVFYVTPVDVQTGEQLLPGQFRQQIEANVARIRATLVEHRPALIDLAMSLEAEAFSWHDYPNEHLCEEGRRLIARSIAETLAASGFVIQEATASPHAGRALEASADGGR